MIKLKNIVRVALLGALGFGIGGLIIGTLIHLLGESISIAFVGPAIAGAVGGASLGVALRRKVWQLALAGTVGLLLGGVLGGLIAFYLNSKADLIDLLISVTPVMIGLLTGASLGWGISSPFRITVWLAVSGILGGGVCVAVTKVITRTWLEPFFITNLDKIYPHAWLLFGLQGIIGGIFLGATLGFLDNRYNGNKNEYDTF
jgi:hypothetical protein